MARDQIDNPPQQAHWGGGFSFRDPEGNVWDVACTALGSTTEAE